MAKDFYQVLGLQKGASAEEVKKAYRKLSKELHPDKHKGDAEAEKRFKAVNEAYEVLSNPQKKQMYDQFGEAGVNGAAGGGQGFSGFDFNGADFGGFGDIFENFFGGGRAGGRRSATAEEGRDLETEVTIELQEVITGVTREIKLRRLHSCDRCGGNGADPGSTISTCGECGGTGQVTRAAQSFFGMIQQRFVCPRCKGSGKVPEKPCSKCSGEGRTAETTTVKVEIPAGIADGQSLRLRGEGEAGRQGANAGSLYVHIRVRPDKRFDRKDDDIHSAKELSVLEAILGATVDVETLHGTVQLKIPEGTQPGQVFRIKGKGVPVLNTSRVGDHFVTVHVKIPTKLSREERKLIEEWRNVTR